ncbi:MAG: murein biosynthesis integral membrane protein MurJ [Anaerolineae bacterium]|nr:MAG: murein biosynthesis integral membrane protein MurJ [Anaerolineae bacterium]
MSRPEHSDPTTNDSGRSQVFRAAGLVASLAMLSRVLGLLREIVVRQFLGVTTLEATAFDVAGRFPETIFLIVAGGAIGSAFIPTFAAYFSRDDEPGAWRLFSAVLNLTTIITTAVSIVVMIFAAPFVTFFYADNIAQEPALLPLTVSLMRIMLLSPIIFGISGIVMAALNARQHFLMPALAPSVYNIGIIIGGLLGAFIGKGDPLPTVFGLAWGTVAGALGHMLVQLPALRGVRARYTPILILRDPGVMQVLRLMGPRVLGLSFSEINKFIILFLTGSMVLGTLPALNAAFRILIMPQGILGQALGIAAFPTLATLAARSAHREMRHILSDSLRLILFLGLPATVLLMLLAGPYVTVLFERGLFDNEATIMVATALQFYAVGLIALTTIEIVARAFYALSDTLTPVLAGGFQILVMWTLSLWLRDVVFSAYGWPPLGALALGFSLSNIVEVMLLLWLVRRKLGGLNGHSLLSGLARMGAASLAMAVAISAVLLLLVSSATWMHAIFGTAVGILAYLLVCWLLRVEELHQFAAMLRRRLPGRK